MTPAETASRHPQEPDPEHERQPAPESASGELMAAVDLGSNSFQLIVASMHHGQLRIIDRLREMVRLAAGLNERQQLDRESQTRALACLARFGERLRDIPADRLRIVGTNTLRKARNTQTFVRRAQQLLGHEIDIVSGIEEARLIYLGVSRSLPVTKGHQLVVDIGGGSTEIAVGKGYQAVAMESLYMGCVGLSGRFFADGKISAKRFEQARTAVRLELRPVIKKFRKYDWKRAAGASGTIRAAAAVLQELRLIDTRITVDALEQLVQLLIDRGHIDKLDLPGLAQERAAVFPGGIAILVELMRELEIRQLIVSQGAMREGILYDLAGRLADGDARVRTVKAMETRFSIDTDQANRVEQTALALLAQAAPAWKLEQVAPRKLLGWAARLHEIGLDIAHSHYHRHGAYLLEHADMPGFNRNEQIILACLVGAHRRKVQHRYFSATAPKGWNKRCARLAILLRLAVLFNRGRSDEMPDPLGLVVQRSRVALQLKRSWLAANPLSLADIEQEKHYLRSLGYELEVIELDG